MLASHGKFSLSEHLGCVHVLTTINSAVVDTGCVYLFVVFGYSEVEFLDYTAVPFLTF